MKGWPKTIESYRKNLESFKVLAISGEGLSLEDLSITLADFKSSIQELDETAQELKYGQLEDKLQAPIATIQLQGNWLLCRSLANSEELNSWAEIISQNLRVDWEEPVHGTAYLCKLEDQKLSSATKQDLKLFEDLIYEHLNI